MGEARSRDTDDERETAGSLSATIAAADGAAGPALRAPADSGALDRIGRFVVLRKLGAGGMGVVYAGYDESLDREVAIKLLLADHGEGTEGRIRMVREAQAMARLSHPNVIHVYEVGELHGRIFLAMELVQGVTLQAWQDQKRRPWREILAMYLQAGRGLAAAHAAGLVHRDVKPDNILVGTDGVARVGDFGLATGDGPSLASSDDLLPDGDREAHHSLLESKVTRVGAMMGTPAYMSPEQARGDAYDARSDQFSFD